MSISRRTRVPVGELARAKHAYTRGLLECLPTLSTPKPRLPVMQRDPAWLAAALAPLKSLPGRCYACLGNHDHEALDTVRTGLAAAGVTQLTITPVPTVSLPRDLVSAMRPALAAL